MQMIIRSGLISPKGEKRHDDVSVQELVVDRDALDQEPLRSEGGFTRLNKVFQWQA
jgi:hypothetical protein